MTWQDRVQVFLKDSKTHSPWRLITSATDSFRNNVHSKCGPISFATQRSADSDIERADHLQCINKRPEQSAIGPRLVLCQTAAESDLPSYCSGTGSRSWGGDPLISLVQYWPEETRYITSQSPFNMFFKPALIKDKQQNNQSLRKCSRDLQEVTNPLLKTSTKFKIS